ncbi:hypothetical protein NJ7G_4261 [Natrinema sp. J7-2]|nr:hypothetical protein NJ7G_4261 [Natrinema sp. J7-2]
MTLFDAIGQNLGDTFEIWVRNSTLISVLAILFTSDWTGSHLIAVLMALLMSEFHAFRTKTPEI